jgi:hypothetical protein
MLSRKRKADQGSCRADLPVRQLVLLSNVMRSLTLARVPLGFQPGVETKVCQLDDDPADQASDSRYVNKPTKDYRRVVRNVQIHKREQDTCESHCIMRRSEAVAALEYLRRMSVAAQAVQCPGCNENTSRGAADGGCADDHVDD